MKKIILIILHPLSNLIIFHPLGSSKRVSTCLTSCRLSFGYEMRPVLQIQELVIAALSRIVVWLG